MGQVPPLATEYGCDSVVKLDYLLDGEAVREQDRLGAAVAAAGGRRVQARDGGRAGGRGAEAMRGERGIGEREHARVYPKARSGGGGRKQDERVCGLWRARALSPSAERAVRHCGKFPNEPVAPLRAGRHRKPLWLQKMARTTRF